MSPSVFATGFAMCASLIFAIGAQNAFVLRQALRREHVLPIILTCALSDAVLIVTGVLLFRQISTLLPPILPVMRYGGAVFLVLYGLRSLKAAFTDPGALAACEAPAQPLGSVMATCLALTWLNPHVYLDTVVLLGSIAAQFPHDRTSFALGAITASFGFFFALGYGAVWLRPILARPSSWRVVEMVIAATMGVTALRLVAGN
ncbi:amino acid transporter [Novosphingobium flavum]|uniref:Amino acid transporter n=1 Tax=Novosphingobium flavum TaxID=1778672 RepID=A0A7X1FSD8_9SPHN|nr:LysE/ArgO family amino acid transporter [Novosphingobium flavum]MBC2666083.1 amino acid transporter [Novosphingobium flavum]